MSTYATAYQGWNCAIPGLLSIPRLDVACPQQYNKQEGLLRLRNEYCPTFPFQSLSKEGGYHAQEQAYPAHRQAGGV